MMRPRGAAHQDSSAFRKPVEQIGNVIWRRDGPSAWTWQQAERVISTWKNPHGHVGVAGLTQRGSDAHGALCCRHTPVLGTIDEEDGDPDTAPPFQSSVLREGRRERPIP